VGCLVKGRALHSALRRKILIIQRLFLHIKTNFRPKSEGVEQLQPCVSNFIRVRFVNRLQPQALFRIEGLDEIAKLNFRSKSGIRHD
jgi:hypothetical protein